MNTLWAAYRTDQHNPFGGREFLGYAGWHTNAADAKAEALARMTTGSVKTAPADVVQVNRA